MKKRIIAYMLMLCQIFQMCGWLTFAEEIQTDTESAEEVIFSYEFESPSEYFMHTGGGLIAHSYSDGAFNLNWDPAAEDRWSYSATTEIPADDVSIITFGVKSNIDCQLKMYYIGENGIGENYTFSFPVFKSDDYIEYKVATATLNGWTGNINQLRIDMDPLNAGEESFTANIDYIRFLNTSENDYLLENITYKLSAYAGNISVYNTDEISIPAIAQAEALKNGFVCQWQKVGEEASGYITIENGKASLVSYPDTDVSSTITLAIKKNSSIYTVDYPITIYKKMFEEVNIADASFENTSLTNGDTIPMTGWHRYEGYDWCIPVSISDKYANSGSNSLYINSYAGSLSSDAALSNSFEVTPGKTYTVDFKVYIPESSPVSSGDYIYPYIQCYDANGNFVVRLNGNQFVKGATNGWVNDSFSREIPTDRGIIYGKVAFFAWGGTAYEAYVDDVSVYVKESGYDEFVSEIKAMSAEKISEAKFAVDIEGTDIELENIGEKIYLSDAVFTCGVNAKITSVSGDGAEYIDNEDYFISLKSRPAHGMGDKTATITVTLEADGYTEDIVYTAIVKEISMQDHFGENILNEVVNNALGTNTSFGAITDNLVFADSYEGYTLTWETSDEDIIDIDGLVTRPTYDNGNETVTITVTAEMDGESFSYSFDVRVLSASYSEMKKITIENNDFETDGGWRVDENRAVNFEFSTKDSFSGNKSLLIPNLSQTANGIIISEKITGIKEGYKYYVEAMVNAENGAKPYVSLRFYNNDGTYLSGGNSNDAYDMNKANEWQSVSASAIAPTGATRVAVAFSGLASGKLAAYFDDVHLYEIPILENGNFEEGLNGWHAEGDVTVAKKNSSDVAKFSGAAKITSSQKPAKKNMHYFARADYKLEDGEGTLSLNFYSSTGILIGTESKKLSANSSWSSASVDFMAPGGTTDVCVEISANGTLYADNVKLSSGAYSTGVLDGSFEDYYNRDIIKKNETEDETEETEPVTKVKNLVYNESFENVDTFALSESNNRSDWAISENYDWVIPITVSSDYANSGSKSAHINNYAASLGATGLFSNTFEVTEGTEYTIEYMLYIPEGSPVPTGDYAYPYLELYDADYNYTRRINGSQFIKGATGEWVKCTFKATPGAGEKFGAFVVYAWKDSPYDAYIDDVCVYSEAVIEEQAPPASNNNNLVSNNSFEGLNKFEIVTNSQTRTGWGITEGNAWNITITPSNAYANSGSTSVYINNYAASLNSEILLSNTFAVVEGTEYTVEYMLYIPEGAPIPSGDYIYPYLEFYDANYTYTHRVNGSKFATGATDGWVKYSFTATPAAGDVYGAFMIGAWSDSPYEAYIDDIRVLKSGAQEITSSSITDENASDGSYSFKATKDNSFTTNPVNTLVGKDYVFTVRAYAESGTGTLTVEYWGWNGGLNTVGGYTGLELLGTDTVNTTTTGEWETLKLKKTMGFKSQYVKLKGSTKDGEVYFDNFDVFAVSDSVSNAEMENVVSLTMDTAISAELYGTVAYDWKPVGMISVLSTSEEKLSGIMSLRVEDLSTEKSGKVTSSMVRNIKPGESYTAELGVKVENGTFNVNLEYFDEDFKLIKAYSEEASSKTWNIITVGGEAPEDAVYAAVSISSSEENEGTCYIDSAKLENSVKDIGSHTQLFIDDYIIKETTMDRTFHEGEKQGIVLEADKPWEGGYYAYVYGSVIYDEEDEIFKMWYTTGDQGQYLAYATSTDGINWGKPILNVYEVNGSTENNILMIAHTPTVIKDNDETDVNKRYKMMCFNFDYSGSPQYANSYYGVRYSADGIHWSDFKKTMWGVDVVTAAYDKTNDEYISLFKKGIESKRIQYMTTSKDFENWTEGVRMNSLADPLDDYGVTKADSYGMMLYPYEGIYIGLDWRMRIPDSHNDGHIDGQLVFSRDLKEDWQRPTRDAILPCGENGEFDDGDIYTASYPIEVGDEIWLYYSGADDTHGAWSFNLKTGLAKWRRDGFASMDAKDGEKTLLTEPMIFTGEELHINANAENGAVYAELLDENMSPISGFTKAECDVISVNSVDNIVSWNGKTDVSALNGETVYLKLYAENSEIYSFGFKAAEEKPGINAIFTQGETITDNKFTDGDLTATVEFGEVVPSAAIVIAQYNGTRLVKSVNTSVSNENSISYTLPEVKVSEGNKIKIFVFESTENLSPICDAFELTAR